MDNKDYNSPEMENPYARPVYETAEEYNQAKREEQVSQEEQPTSGEGTFAYNQFENNAYNNYANNNYYGNNGYTNMGGVILDSKGKEVKNYFGLQLTFSIIEMICCCCSCISLITGIIACIFTCQANTAFKEGRYDDHKSKSRVSTVSLIIGAVFLVISFISNVVNIAAMSQDGFWDTFMIEFEKAMEEELGEDIDMDTFFDDLTNGVYDDIYTDGFTDGDIDDDYYSEYNKDADHENFEDFNEIIVNGVNISLPCTYADLQAAGFFMNALDLSTPLEGGEEMYFELHSPEKAYIADVQIMNDGKTICTAEEGTIVYLAFYLEDASEMALLENYEFVNGLDFSLTVDETLNLLGEANSIYKEEDDHRAYECYSWDYVYMDEYYSFVAVSFYDGNMYSIQVNNGPAEY